MIALAPTLSTRLFPRFSALGDAVKLVAAAHVLPAAWKFAK